MPLAEARRILDICAVCGYCNGFCEAFRALDRYAARPASPPSDNTQPRAIADADIVYLAHLCHNCGNCLPACQYAPPHHLAVNVPRTLAEVRRGSWRDRPWLALIWIAAIPLSTLALVPWDILFAPHTGEGAFYAVLSLKTLVVAASIPMVLSAAILALRMRAFWRETGGGWPWKAAPVALGESVLLRNLEGGGRPCEQGPARRLFHTALFFGFMLCFAATVVAAFYHHALGLIAPYPFASVPVLLGTVGGVGMIAGSAGLAWLKVRAQPELDATPKRYFFLALLFAVAASGLLLLALRDTAAMGMLLAAHIGLVVGLFATFPYGKFAHAPYRAAALLRAALERGRHPGSR